MRVHDECALFFLVVFIGEQCVVVDGFGASELLVYVHDLLLEVVQPVPVSHDIVGDVSFETLDARHAALEKGMQNDFLWGINAHREAGKVRHTSEVIVFEYLSR